MMPHKSQPQLHPALIHTSNRKDQENSAKIEKFSTSQEDRQNSPKIKRDEELYRQEDQQNSPKIKVGSMTSAKSRNFAHEY